MRSRLPEERRYGKRFRRRSQACIVKRLKHSGRQNMKEQVIEQRSANTGYREPMILADLGGQRCQERGDLQSRYDPCGTERKRILQNGRAYKNRKGYEREMSTASTRRYQSFNRRKNVSRRKDLSTHRRNTDRIDRRPGHACQASGRTDGRRERIRKRSGRQEDRNRIAMGKRTRSIREPDRKARTATSRLDTYPYLR